MTNINKIFGCGVGKKTTELTSEGETFICPNCQTKNIIPKDIDISEKTVKDIMQLIIAIVAICFMISIYSCTKKTIVPIPSEPTDATAVPSPTPTTPTVSTPTVSTPTVSTSGTSGTNCSSRQCIGRTQAGNRCKNKTTNCDSRCYLH